MRLPFGFATCGMRIDAERFFDEYASLTGASKPGTRRLYEFVPGFVIAFSAMVMAGLDGVENKIHPGEAASKDLYHLPPEEDAKIPTVCSSLEQALEYLDKGRAFLTKGGVFTDAYIDAYIDLKMQEVTRFRMTTHPIEFDMYYSL